MASTHTWAGRRWMVLAGACLTALCIPLSITAPAVAMPAIARTLGGSPLALSWIINGYLMTFGSTMMFAGNLADTLGRKRVWLSSLVWFCIIGALVPLVPGTTWTAVTRLLQGLCASGAMTGSAALLAQEFSGHLRAKVFSLIGTSFGVGLAFGPLLAGWLIDSRGWSWIFYFTALVAALSVLCIVVAANESKDPQTKGLDLPGAATSSGAIVLFNVALLLAPGSGWNSVGVLTSLGGCAVLLAAFVRIEHHSLRPMLDLSLFKRGTFNGVQLLALALAFVYIVPVILLPQRFIGADGYSAMDAGKLMVALSVPLLLVPPLSGWASRWISPALLAGSGLLGAGAGVAWLAVVLSTGTPEDAWPAMLAIGCCIGLPWGLVDGLAVGVVEPDRAGMASGVFNTIRLSADGVATALAGAALSLLVQTSLATLAGTATPHARVVEAATVAAMGNVPGARRLVPLLGAHMVSEAYNAAFRETFLLLAAFAVVAAVTIYVLLRHLPRAEPAHAEPDTAKTPIAYGAP